MARMTPSLSVALVLWVEAYKAAINLDKCPNDMTRIRDRSKVIKDLQTASDNLALIAQEDGDLDHEKSGVPGRAQRDIVETALGPACLPTWKNAALLVDRVADLISQTDRVQDKEFPSNSDYKAIETAEKRLRCWLLASLKSGIARTGRSGPRPNQHTAAQETAA